MNAYFNTSVKSFDTGGHGTLFIGASFIFIAYFLHPAVESAYHRVRAYRAWRALEMRQSVEVTNYPMLAETLGGRGKWDTARIITVLLAVFSLFSWGLELWMDLAYHEGNADLLNQPPPVILDTINNSTGWQVRPKKDFLYEDDWKTKYNMDDDEARSMYNVVEKVTCHKGDVQGSIRVAQWSTDAYNEYRPAPLYYAPNTSADTTTATTVESLQCTEGPSEKPITVQIVGHGPNETWGTVDSCDNGPKLFNLGKQKDDADAPPMLILNRSSDGHTFLIVEESSNYPSFMYSVWTNGTQRDDLIELTHVFYIAATMRLAEAVVTTIVQGNTTGRDCFLLVRVNSKLEKNDDNDPLLRAKPFGEDPLNKHVLIQELETIECGLEIDRKALVCLVLLILLTSVGIAWSFCLQSSIGMNVYDRDELIRAVSMSVASGSTRKSAIRIFVSKEDCGNLRVVISDTGDAETGCERIFRRGRPVVEDGDPAPDAAQPEDVNDAFSGTAVPLGRTTVSLEGVRTGRGRRWPGRNGDCHYPSSPASVTLSASPVPQSSPAPSSSSSVLVATPTQLSPVPRVPLEGPGLAGRGRGASVLFDATFSLSDSGEDEPYGMWTDRPSENEEGGAPGAHVEAHGGQGGATPVPEGIQPPEIEGPRASDRRRRRGLSGMSMFSSRRLVLETIGRAPPVAPLQREATLGPPTLGPLTQT